MRRVHPPAPPPPAVPWDERPADAGFFLDSGLLFQINLEFLHPLGLSITVRTDQKTGEKSLGLKDMRASPGEMLFDPQTAAAGRAKFNAFMRQHGRALLARRKRAIGREVQDINPRDPE